MKENQDGLMIKIGDMRRLIEYPWEDKEIETEDMRDLIDKECQTDILSKNKNKQNDRQRD